MDTEQVSHRAYKRERTATQVYDQQVKLYALSIYAETLSQTEASRATGIPKTTIHQWVNEEGSDLILDQLRTALRSEVAHKYAMIAVKSANELLDRLEFGDEVIDSQGNYMRKKVSARDLITVSSMAADRFTLLTGTAQAQGKANATLTLLADKLMQAMQAAAPKKEADSTQLPVDNAK